MILTNNIIINEKNIKYIKPETRSDVVNGMQQNYMGVLVGYMDGETAFHTNVDFQQLLQDILRERAIELQKISISNLSQQSAPQNNNQTQQNNNQTQQNNNQAQQNVSQDNQAEQRIQF